MSPGVTDNKDRWLLRAPFRHDDGHAWGCALPDLPAGDHAGDGQNSLVVLYEDGVPLESGHALHDDIRRLGGGRYSHWGKGLLFSASDNTDPNTNGRDYEVRVEPLRDYEDGCFLLRRSRPAQAVPAILTACPVCDGLDHHKLFPAFHGQFHEGNYQQSGFCRFQNVVICRDCGAVFRNPVIPSLNVVHYQSPANWDPLVFRRRFDLLAEMLVRRVVGTGACRHLDVGAGPGWLVESLRRHLPQLRSVMIEPSPAVAASIIADTADMVLPSYVHETRLPAQGFNLITVCGVDYLFNDHRRDMDHIVSALAEDGVLYVERNVFLDQKAFCGFPIRDLEDLFGANAMMSLWLGRDQFVDYMGRYVEVFDVVDYVSDQVADVIARPNALRGIFGRRRGGNTPYRGPPRYRQHLEQMRQLVRDTSLAELRALSGVGIRRLGVYGTGAELAALKDCLREIPELVVAFAEDADKPDSLPTVLAADIDAILVVSLRRQQAIISALRRAGFGGVVLPCLRQGIDLFSVADGDGGSLQVKAFMPFFLHTLSSRSLPE